MNTDPTELAQHLMERQGSLFPLLHTMKEPAHLFTIKHVGP